MRPHISTLWQLLISLSVPVILSQRRPKLQVELFDSIDALKKLLRTKNNVLILYRQTNVQSITQVVTDAAGKLYGKATVAVVDCTSDDGRKTCKKMKIPSSNGRQFFLYHYHNGKFHKEYDRSLNVNSLTRFMQDPTADLPWEEEEGSEDVLHISDTKVWKLKLKREKKPILAMFYAPWCGYCKRLKPEFSAAAAELKNETILAALDVTQVELYELQKLYNISGFPTLLYFKNGELLYPYGGQQTKDGLIKWTRSPSAGTISGGSVEEINWSDEKSSVVHLTDETFDRFLLQNPSVLVMFYAPWCGHCKAMKPAYTEAAKLLSDEKVPGILAAVDASKEKSVADKFDIKGFPTVKYFKDGVYAWDFNDRSVDKLTAFMKNPQEPPPPPPPEIPWSEEVSAVIHLNENNFEAELKKLKHALVMFYAPWCGHCKQAKPEFTMAAEHFKDNSEICFAAVDCSDVENIQLCKSQDIQGFPTIKYFSYFKNSENYYGIRSAGDFIGYMDARSIKIPAAEPEVAENQQQNLPGNSNDSANVPLYDEDEDDTSDPDGWGHVLVLTSETFDSTLSALDRTLVMFFSPQCRFCHERKPEFIAAAARVNKRRKDIKLAAMNCVEHFDKCQEMRVSGYPAFYLYEKMKFVDVHHGEPERNNFVRTIMAHLLKKEEEPKPPSIKANKAEL